MTSLLSRLFLVYQLVPLEVHHRPLVKDFFNNRRMKYFR
jgi:hypothetical protein